MKKIKLTTKNIAIAGAIVGASTLATILIATLAVGMIVRAEPGHILKGVNIASIDIGGKTPEFSRVLLQKELNDYQLEFSFGNRTKTIHPFIAESNHPAIAHLDINTAIAAAEKIDTASTPSAWLAKAQTFFFGNNVGPTPSIDEAGLTTWLNQEFGDLVTSPVNAHFSVNEQSELIIEDGVAGEQLLFDVAIKAATHHVENLSPTHISISSTKARPTIEAINLEAHRQQAESIIAIAPITFTSNQQITKAFANDIARWLSISIDGQLIVEPTQLEPTISELAQKIITEPQNAKFEELNGRVTTLIPDVPGTTVDLHSLANALNIVLFGENPAKQPTVDVPLKEQFANIRLADANPYGITDILGIGESNFKGSPVNRIHNINVGKNAINGLIVQPGETFSLIGALGVIDASSGYRTELVIKGDKTTPEFGGGLCQVGTTLFRATLNAGVQITERRNHSYRVSYYERAGDGSYMGPGKDATIYDPWPDFKFTNDTSAAIVIQTKAVGNTLTFTLWGKPDGRKAEQTDAKILSTTPPPPPKLIPTTDLAPGVKKCTEKPHAGAQVVFTYTVTHPDGRVETQDFFSNYRPWGEVCLIGIDPNAPPPADPTPTLPTADTSGTTGI